MSHGVSAERLKSSSFMICAGSVKGSEPVDYYCGDHPSLFVNLHLYREWEFDSIVFNVELVWQ